MDEKTAVKRFSGKSPQSTYIPFDIKQEMILCRLPVKSLLRFRCVCKPWDSLISKDLKFTKKHLRLSPKRQHLVTTTTTWTETEELTVSVMSCPFDSLNLHSNFDSKSIQLDYSPRTSISCYDHYQGLVASCDDILCFVIDERHAVLYNPSIRKLQKLPNIDLPREEGLTYYAFGYDPFIDNYKVVAVSDMYTNEREIHSYTLGTDSWKRIKDFPSMFHFDTFDGIFMRGTVNWLTAFKSNRLKCIVSLHLGKESYQEISLPDRPKYKTSKMLTLYVLRDCLCVFAIFQERRSYSFIDVWLMKEHGNKESWIKLIHLPFFAGFAYCTDIVYQS